jgi:regulator of CtrA degradation
LRRAPAATAERIGPTVNMDGTQVAYLDSTYQEALGLLREARDYVAGQERQDHADLAPVARLALSCETMRLTARLTQSMAWLLTQKAVQAGELGREAARAPEHRLSGRAACLRTAPVTAGFVPSPRLQALLTRSHNLYCRVERLDALLGPALAEGEGPGSGEPGRDGPERGGPAA